MKLKKYVSMVNQQGLYLRESGYYTVDGRRRYDTPNALADLFGNIIDMRHFADEHVYVACLDIANHLVGCFEASHGAVNTTLFPIREILQKALLLGAVNIAISHNHPSGDCSPSAADSVSTARLKQAADIIGINLIDHIIIGSIGGYYSFCIEGTL